MTIAENELPKMAEKHPLEQGYPKYEVNRRPMRDWEDAKIYLQVHGGTLMEKIDAMTPWHVLQSKPKTSHNEP
jgi:hypothetical protein